MPNYNRENLKLNDTLEYEYFFDKRGLEFISHYGTKLLTPSGSLTISVYEHTWRQGDKLYKLASENYNDFRFWWIIAMVNNIASEADLKYGQKILIPLDITQFLSII